MDFVSGSNTKIKNKLSTQIQQHNCQNHNYVKIVQILHLLREFLSTAWPH